jgi:hypothetical protein
MMWLISAYWICLFVGAGYTIVSFILGEVGGAFSHAGTLHGDFGHGGQVGETSHTYGVHGAHDGGVGKSLEFNQGDNVIFGPFSPLVIAFFLACFGGTGLILSRLNVLSVFVVLACALVTGVFLAYLLLVFINKVLGNLQSSSEVRLGTLVGEEAEVTVAIPEHGFGEIAYVAMGQRCVAPARSDESENIPRFAAVRITRVVGNNFYVSKRIEDQIHAVPAPTDEPAPQD